MSGVKFKSQYVANPSLSREKALWKLRGKIRSNEKIDIIRTSDGYKLTRSTVFAGKRGVTAGAQRYLNSLDLYVQPEDGRTRKDALQAVAEEVNRAVTMESFGFIWKSRGEMYVPLGCMEDSPGWKMVEGISGDLFAMIDCPDSGDEKRRLLKNLSKIVGDDSLPASKVVDAGSQKKLLVPLTGGKDARRFVNDVSASGIVISGEVYGFTDEIGKAGGSVERPIRKAVSDDGTAIVAKPMLRTDSREMKISERVGGDGVVGKTRGREDRNHILQCFGTVKNPHFGKESNVNTCMHEYLLCSEYAEWGTVGRYINDVQECVNVGTLDQDEADALVLNISGQMCRAVEQFHACGYGHHDLKPENFYVCNVDGVPVVKLGDFGTAHSENFPIHASPGDELRFMSAEMREVFDHPGNKIKADETLKLKNREEGLRNGLRKGIENEDKIARMQPEKIKNRKMDKNIPGITLFSDVSSLGSTIWAICCNDAGSPYEQIVPGEGRSWLGKGAEKKIRGWIADTFNEDPQARPSARRLARRFLSQPGVSKEEIKRYAISVQKVKKVAGLSSDN
jgi:serine/threonine protein kinase